jgi:hypothetical protein
MMTDTHIVLFSLLHRLRVKLCIVFTDNVLLRACMMADNQMRTLFCTCRLGVKSCIVFTDDVLLKVNHGTIGEMHEKYLIMPPVTMPL